MYFEQQTFSSHLGRSEAHWVNGDDRVRGYGAGGVRCRLWLLHGLLHAQEDSLSVQSLGEPLDLLAVRLAFIKPLCEVNLT